MIAKINKSACDFDTSPTALKALKAAHTPDAVVLAMVGAEPSNTPVPSGEPAHVKCNHTDPVPVFSAPRSDSVEAFKVKCGDRMTVIGPTDKQSWIEVRNSEGRAGFISSVILSIDSPTEPEKLPSSSDKQNANKREELQKAADDYDDCRTQAQNEYDTKMNAVGTLTLSPMQRVYASNRLKQNFDARVRSCRTQYESRVKMIEAR